MSTRKKSYFNRLFSRKSKKLDSKIIKSYSPSLNKKLSLQSKLISVKTLKACNSNNNDINNIKINIGDNNNENCLDFNNNEEEFEVLKTVLLNNLKSNKKLDINKLIPPNQVLDNCWFNTMFVAFFFSDKGRKFFRFFRKLMITGKKMDNTEIEDKRLKKLLFILNIFIEASYNKKKEEKTYKKLKKEDKKTYKKNKLSMKSLKAKYIKKDFYSNLIKLTDNLHTNYFIKNIYNIINNIDSKNSKNSKNRVLNIPNIKEAGNPIYYYKKIIEYLEYNILKFDIIELNNNYFGNPLFYIQDKLLKRNSIPDIIILEDHESKCIHNDKFKIKFNKKTYNYSLDSIIITNKGHYDPDENSHFVCVLTINGIEYKYDGDSEKKIGKLNWKELINKDIDWVFKENEKYIPEKYNFTKGYKMMFYYRI
jgi:hypothetical protein